MFAFLVLFSSLLIESIGTYVSVVGLSSLFAANPVIITLAMALDLGKIVCVSFLYRHWKSINIVMRGYMLSAAAVLIIITSAGAFGYLSAQFQKAISDTNSAQIMINALTEEQSRLQKRKEEIDAQIAKLPDNSVRGRTSLIKQFAPEVEHLNTRLIEIDNELPKLKIENVKKSVEVGPIIYIAEAFNTDPEHAVKWVIMIIIFVFDPLAIVLLLAGNYLLAIRKQELEAKEAIRDRLDMREVLSGAITKFREKAKPKEIVPPTDVAIPITPEDTVTKDYADEQTGIIVPAVEQLIEIQDEVKTEEPKETAPSVNEVEDEDILIVDDIAEEHPVDPREIITLDQITGHPPVHRSLLESINTMSDVIINDQRLGLDKSLVKKYTEDGIVNQGTVIK